MIIIALFFVLSIVLAALAFHRTKRAERSVLPAETAEPNSIERMPFSIVLCYIATGISTLSLLFLLLVFCFAADINGTMVVITFLFAALWFITIPGACLYFYSFVRSLFSNNRHSRKLLWLHTINMLLVCMLAVADLQTGQTCDADTMEAHYRQYGRDMQTLVNDIRHGLPDSTRLSVEFIRYGKVDRLFLKGHNSISYNREIDSIGMLKTRHAQTAGITPERLETLYQRLKAVGCRGIDIDNYSRNPAVLLFRRVSMGAYYFCLYDIPLTDNELKELTSDDAMIVLNRRVVLQYGGGAIGGQNFIGKEEFEQRRHRADKE